jgi:hypothetical protein
MSLYTPGRILVRKLEMAPKAERTTNATHREIDAEALLHLKDWQPRMVIDRPGRDLYLALRVC